MKKEENKTCPSCKAELPFDLNVQFIGNNCGCGFPTIEQIAEYKKKIKHTNLPIKDWASWKQLILFFVMYVGCMVVFAYMVTIFFYWFGIKC